MMIDNQNNLYQDQIFGIYFIIYNNDRKRRLKKKKAVET